MKNLDMVTLICVEGNYSFEIADQAIRVLLHCSKEINFGEKIFISPPIEHTTKKALDSNGIIHYDIPQFDWLDYNRFVVKDYYKYIKTDFCLVVQRDGFILNPHLWDDRFLDYDYIGAKWCPHHLAGCRWIYPETRQRGPLNLVGNGGFSLRSKKSLYETANAPFPVNGPEDAYICNNHLDYFLERGLKYGTEEIADKFSREMNKSLSFDQVFGFHGEKHFINNI
jgi:hypothetical protein